MITMQYMKPVHINKTGRTLYVPLTEAFAILGWKWQDQVQIVVPDGKIVIKKIDESITK